MNESMNLKEKILYHQIHPLKLLADWVPGLGSIYLMWRHKLGATLLSTFIPAVLGSLIVIKTADLEPYRNSKFGHYMKRYMTPLWEGVRFCGMVIMWIGGWRHSWRLIFSGLLVVTLGWANGLLIPNRSEWHSIFFRKRNIV